MLNNMKSVVGLILGASVVAGVVGCDNGGDDPKGTGGTGNITLPGASGSGTGNTGTGNTGNTGVVPMAGTTGTGTAGTDSGTGGSGGGMLPEGVGLTPMNGWIAGDSNMLAVQGAVFSFADDYSKAGPPMMSEDFTMANACIKGTAAKVDAKCTIPMPAPAGVTDCYGLYWGAAIGLNLNQPTMMDPTTLMDVGGTPAPFDASKITGFAFELTGAMVPVSLRFKIDSGDGTEEYCTGAETPIKLGANTVKFDQLRTKCWEPLSKQPTPAKGTAIQSKVVKIAWQVVTNQASAVPFDFCVANIRALTTP